MTIENISQNAISELLEIEEEVFPNPWRYEDFEIMLFNSPYNFLLKEKNEIIGYFCSLVTDKIIHITNFAIAKKYQDNGLGYLFLKILIKSSNQDRHPTFFLEVRKSNKKAIHLYEKLGFEIADIIQNYYKNPQEDALLMVKDK